MFNTKVKTPRFKVATNLKWHPNTLCVKRKIVVEGIETERYQYYRYSLEKEITEEDRFNKISVMPALFPRHDEEFWICLSAKGDVRKGSIKALLRGKIDTKTQKVEINGIRNPRSTSTTRSREVCSSNESGSVRQSCRVGQGSEAEELQVAHALFREQVATLHSDGYPEEGWQPEEDLQPL